MIKKPRVRRPRPPAPTTTTPTAPTTPPPADPTPAPASGGFPLTGDFEAGRRALDDQLMGALGSLTAQRQLIGPQLNLYLTRLGNDQTVAAKQLRESMAARGIYNSGVTRQNQILQNTDYDRTRQDYGTNAAQQYSALAQQEQEARLSYARGLQDLLLRIAAAQAGSPYLTT